MTVLALCSAAAAALALGQGYASGRMARAGHLARIQGREFALGARALAPGTYAVGMWTITVAPDHAVAARGRAGVCAIAADGRETWVAGAVTARAPSAPTGATP
jgi:hypothetical protein